MDKRVLMTGFDPFGGETINPAWEAVRRLDGRALDGGWTIVAQQVPTVFDRSIAVLREAIGRVQPEVVICVGQAGGRAQITPERVAINVNDARIPDNAGQQPIDTPVVPGGPAAYFTKLPIKRIVAVLREAGIPAAVSNTAGTYVCNHIFYGLMHLIATEHPQVRGGFVHIPYLPEQVTGKAEPSMALDLIVRGLERVAAVSAAAYDAGSEADLAVTAGQEC
ncbi:MAG: pyroglutamyl-peptidase I [Alicyclobacillus macrosporangiidus]|uniref:pyroglutamyl-peptidase I n=1 Tax=Alicyclobacillus macrosporangiidus TaxID=392015 RepID=UPI0026F13ABA|nr:pyroglutamyl-peptidase I [Alicyclobacillus macrosporangiidus]MCL6597415.1 pyroglutamyl-peptidase I [Alicyclobacillus macrosporangiidus]